MSEHRKHHHRHYRMSGWVAPMMPLNEVQFTGSPTPPADSTPADGADGAVAAGDAGASV